ncbi:MAG: hypothetical protein HXX08_11460 [Chloroflexi bacterium]|uniref:Uncharacterized protein n=1 Tax=Candidatus Chlorohelix allophototropha TaxID=3003348 RepID=A0A8T7LZM1_9CHLR|nr:hypothetical protein [Chloroflexota bacterium]WJW65855.1 hypothetical protein OZ401_001634 [Chloroflexota bacterium L227-S17]
MTMKLTKEQAEQLDLFLQDCDEYLEYADDPAMYIWDKFFNSPEQREAREAEEAESRLELLAARVVRRSNRTRQ